FVGGFFLAENDKIHAHDLQLRGDAGARINGVRACAAQAVGQNLSLLPTWSDQSIGLPAMFGAFTECKDRRIVWTRQIVPDDDAASNGQSSSFGYIDVGTDSRADY